MVVTAALVVLAAQMVALVEPAWVVLAFLAQT